MMRRSNEQVSQDVQTLQAERDAYKVALATAQQEAAHSAASAAEHSARADRLDQLLQRQAEQNASQLRAAARLLDAVASPRKTDPGSPFSSQLSHQQPRQQSSPVSSTCSSPGRTPHRAGGDTHKAGSTGGLGGTASDESGSTRKLEPTVSTSYEVLTQRLLQQRHRITGLNDALQEANKLRLKAVEDAAVLTAQLAASTRQERLLESECDELRQRLQLTAGQLQAKDQVIHQMREASQRHHAEGISGGLTAAVSLAEWSAPSSHAGGDVGSVVSDVTVPYNVPPAHQHCTVPLTLHQPSPQPTADVAGVKRDVEDEEVSSFERTVLLWRDTYRASEARVLTLECELEAARAQLKHARLEVAQLTQQVVHSDQERAGLQQRLGLQAERVQAQIDSMEEQLEDKRQELTAMRKRLGDAQAQQQAESSRADQLERQLQATSSERDASRAAAEARQRELHASTREAQELRQQLEDMSHRSEHIREEASGASDQILAIQEGLSRQQREVERLVSVLRTALLAASPHQHTDPPSPGQPPMQVLEEYICSLSAELGRKTAQASEASARGAAAEVAAQRHAQEARAMEGRIKSLDEKVSDQQSALAQRADEVSRLQSTLRRKEADCQAIEAEIQRQLEDYQRLKQRLMQQERDGSQFALERSGVAQRLGELEALLAAKQDECALAVGRCHSQQEQLAAARQAQLALQERLHAFESQAESSQRQQAHAALVRQDAAGAVEAARAEGRASAQAAQMMREQVERKNLEIRELNQMLKAWEAMRLGKDAQIAALMERCKRHEEEEAEKARTIDALRRKLAATSRASHQPAASGTGGGTGGAAAASYVPARHIHVHMHAGSPNGPASSVHSEAASSRV